MRSVLFLCLGNVCRSPYAAASFGRMAPAVKVDSAGFIGPGRSADDRAREVAKERGLDLSAHISKVVTASLVRAWDLIVVMDPRQRSELLRNLPPSCPVIVLGDLDPYAQGRRTILDPWGKAPEVFRDTFDRIDRCLGEMLGYVIRAERPPADVRESRTP